MATRGDVLRLRIDVDSKQAIKETKQFEKAVTGSNARVVSSNKKVAAGFEGSRIAVARMRNATLLVSFAISGTVLVLDKLAKKAEEVGGLERAFGTLSGRIGELSGEFMPQMQAATKGLLSEMELMKQANNAIILGVAKTSDQFSQLTNTALKLGKAVGLDARAAVESLVVGIGRQSRMMLDNLGIIVKVEEANQAYAAALGVNVSELTLAQQKQAFMNAAMLAATAAAAGLELNVDTLSGKWSQLTTEIANTTAGLLDFINNAPSGIERLIGMLKAGDVEGALGFQGDKLSSTSAGDGLTKALARSSGTAEELRAIGDKFGVDLSNSIALAVLREMKTADLVGPVEEAINVGGPLKIGFEPVFDLGAVQRPPFEQMLSDMGIKTTDELNMAGKRIAEAFQGLGAQNLSPERTAAVVDELVKAAEAVTGAGGLVPGFEQVAAETEKIQQYIMSADEAMWIWVQGGAAALGESLAATNVSMESLGEAMSRSLRGIGVDAAMDLGDTMVDAAFGAEVAWDKFFKQLLKDIAKAIIKALILKAITKGIGGGGGAAMAGGGIAGGSAMAHGGIAGARNGLMVRGGIPGRDSVPIMAQRGEAVLPVKLTNLLRGAAENSQQRAAGPVTDLSPTTSTPSLNAASAASTSMSVNIYANDARSFRDYLEDQPEALMAAFRRAQRVGG